MLMKKTRLTVSLGAAIAAMVTASPVYAQEAQKLERIEITGSRIRQIDAETAQPVLKLTQTDIQKSGLVTVGDILNQLSSAGTPDFSKGSVLTANREQGGEYINLRNLGSQRLLVLVNGKRWSQSVDGFTDLSTIPASLLDRVEVLKDGASAVYGSDAIAGVVNFILKKSMDGGSISVYQGANEAGDGDRSDVSLSYGVSSDKGSLVFGFTYTKVDPVWAKDREITATSYGPEFATAGLGLGPWGRVRATTTNAAGVTVATGPTYVLNHTGSYDGVGQGQASNSLANFHTPLNPVDDAFNPTMQMMFTTPTEQKTIFTHGNLDITPSIRFNTTAMFAQRSSTRQIAGYPLQSTSQPTFNVFIDKDSYYNPLGNQGVGVAAGTGVDAFFQRRTIEIPRVTVNNNRTTHLDAALEGDLDLGGLAWSWSFGINYSDVSGEAVNSGNINLVNLKRALGPSFREASGRVVCGTPTNPIGYGLTPGSCVPFDILGGPSASTADALAYINQKGVTIYGSTVRSLHADISGEVFKLPGGMMTVAGGVERREVKGFDKPGVFEQNGLSTDLAGGETNGDYDIKEAYLELNLPVLKGVFGAEYLGFNVASRYSDYSNFGDTTNSKFSFMYRPIKDVLVRGTYAEGFRAPTLGDTSGGGSQSFAFYTDPCDTQFGAARNNATVQARCTAAGVPANFRQRGQNGLPITAPNTQSPYPFSQGLGNADLQPETATTKTFGVVYSPAFLPGFTAALDWYRIQVDNEITGLSTNYMLNQCYVTGNNEFCAAHTREASGQVLNVNIGSANLGGVLREGFDLALNYRFPASSFGRFAVRSETTYIKRQETRGSAGGTWSPVAGAGVGENDVYRIKSNLGIDWSMGDFGVTLGTRYYSATKTNGWDCDPAAPVRCSNPNDEWTAGTGYHKLKALVYNDLSFTYQTPWKGTLLVGVNNVFDVKPRINFDIGSSSSSVNPELPIDRSWFIRYTQAF